jgi:hypothetical protein
VPFTTVASSLDAPENMVFTGRITLDGQISVPMAKFWLGVKELTESVVSPTAAADESVTVCVTIEPPAGA